MSLPTRTNKSGKVTVQKSSALPMNSKGSNKGEENRKAFNLHALKNCEQNSILWLISAVTYNGCQYLYENRKHKRPKICESGYYLKYMWDYCVTNNNVSVCRL